MVKRIVREEEVMDFRLTEGQRKLVERDMEEHIKWHKGGEK